MKIKDLIQQANSLLKALEEENKKIELKICKLKKEFQQKKSK